MFLGHYRVSAILAQHNKQTSESTFNDCYRSQFDTFLADSSSMASVNNISNIFV